MTAKYSILSVLIRPEIQEKISVGLLLFNNDEVYFSYSKNKLQVLKELLSQSSYKILRDVLESIEKKVAPDNQKALGRKGFNIFKNNILDQSFSTSYISYLSKYSNNIISFTNPKEIYLEINNQNFSSLFKKYIDDIFEVKEEQSKIKPFEYIKTQFGDRITKHYELSKELTHQQVKNLIIPVRVDFAGKNEINVFAQTVDMEASLPTITHHINSFIQLKATYNKNEMRIKDFIITKEPSKKDSPKNHAIWKQLKSSNILHYLDLSESEAIITYAEKHGVVPLTQSSETK
jgi:hypothetical protein